MRERVILCTVPGRVLSYDGIIKYMIQQYVYYTAGSVQYDVMRYYDIRD